MIKEYAAPADEIALLLVMKTSHKSVLWEFENRGMLYILLPVILSDGVASVLEEGCSYSIPYDSSFFETLAFSNKSPEIILTWKPGM
jgi:hypothetical protein